MTNVKFVRHGWQSSYIKLSDMSDKVHKKINYEHLFTTDNISGLLNVMGVYVYYYDIIFITFKNVHVYIIKTWSLYVN